MTWACVLCELPQERLWQRMAGARAALPRGRGFLVPRRASLSRGGTLQWAGPLHTGVGSPAKGAVWSDGRARAQPHHHQGRSASWHQFPG